MHVELELELELAVVMGSDVGCVEDGLELDDPDLVDPESVGPLDGEESGEGPSMLGGDVQPPTEIPKILIQGR